MWNWRWHSKVLFALLVVVVAYLGIDYLGFAAGVLWKLILTAGILFVSFALPSILAELEEGWRKGQEASTILDALGWKRRRINASWLPPRPKDGVMLEALGWFQMLDGWWVPPRRRR